MDQARPLFPQNAPMKKTNAKILSQTGFTMRRRLVAHNRDFKQDDAFNTTWWLFLSIDKYCQVTSLLIERIDHHVVLLEVPIDPRLETIIIIHLMSMSLILRKRTNRKGIARSSSMTVDAIVTRSSECT